MLCVRHTVMITTFGGNTQLLESLCSSDVDFVIVGGVAVHFYNASREIDDLDIMIRSSEDNAQKLIAALTTIALSIPHSAEAIAKPKVQIPLKGAQYADIITPGSEMDFDEIIGSAECGVVNGVSVKIAGKGTLIVMKNTDRPKDVNDIQLLT